MCEEWEPLADIYFASSNDKDYVYCLCSRVFIRSKPIEDDNNGRISEDSQDSDDDILPHLFSTEKNQDPTQNTTNSKLQETEEALSCYYSASHTDNISTDEHDSIREVHSCQTVPKGIQQSDSGTDLTEHQEDHQNNALRDAWMHYWLINGERLIWESWIEKYNAYINPEYIASKNDTPKTESNDKAITVVSKSSNDVKSDCKKQKRVSISDNENDVYIYSQEDPLEVSAGTKKTDDSEVARRNYMLIRNLSGSDSYDKLNVEQVVAEGWNPLSSSSADLDIETERLLSPRCGSVTSSTAKTTITTDSMTNVTKITVSSLDLSDSSNSSISVSSPEGSVQNSPSDGSSEEDVSSDQYWQLLWQQHFEEQYEKHYNEFVLSNSAKGQNFSELKLDYSFVPKDNYSLDECSESRCKEITLKLKGGNDAEPDGAAVGISGNDFGSQVSNSGENLCEDVLDIKVSLQNMQMGGDGGTNKTENCEQSPSVLEDSVRLGQLGLPTQFGMRRKTKRKHDSIEESTETGLQGRFKSGRSASDQIRSALSLMGYAFSGKSVSPENDKGKGGVIYRKKHIRLQNRHLKFKHPQVQPKHIHFDDDGNIVEEGKEVAGVLKEEGPGEIVSAEETVSVFAENEAEASDHSEAVVEEAKDSSKSKSRKRKKRMGRDSCNKPPEIRDRPEMDKYWHRRFILFSKFDQGIKLDYESWYSVTPEEVAKYTAKRCKCDVIVDAFCGAGGNAIQFAFTCGKVIAIDIDPKKIELAKNNAKIYGVLDRIDFRCGDYLKMVDELQADVVFLSPPWGGPGYADVAIYNLETMLMPVPASELLFKTRKITRNIAMFLPRNSDMDQLYNSYDHVETEQNFVDKKSVGLGAYFGKLIGNKNFPSPEDPLGILHDDKFDKFYPYPN